MDASGIKKILSDVEKKKISVPTAMAKLRYFPFHDMGFAKVDTQRHLRCGFTEVVFCLGKKVSEVRQIFAGLAANGGNVIATRADKKIYNALKKKFPAVVYHQDARMVTLKKKKIKPTGLVVTASGGTADIPVAEEACITAELMGARVERVYDVGVAGIHRLLAYRERFREANVIIAVAGMEGALPSVIAGLVDKPVIAVPTSVGYGTAFSGIAPLLTMLNSCVAGIVTVNIDNGFGAGYAAGLINKTISDKD